MAGGFGRHPHVNARLDMDLKNPVLVPGAPQLMELKLWLSPEAAAGIGLNWVKSALDIALRGGFGQPGQFVYSTIACCKMRDGEEPLIDPNKPGGISPIVGMDGAPMPAASADSGQTPEVKE